MQVLQWGAQNHRRAVPDGARAAIDWVAPLRRFTISKSPSGMRSPTASTVGVAAGATGVLVGAGVTVVVGVDASGPVVGPVGAAVGADSDSTGSAGVASVEAPGFAGSASTAGSGSTAGTESGGVVGMAVGVTVDVMPASRVIVTDSLVPSVHAEAISAVARTTAAVR